MQFRAKLCLEARKLTINNYCFNKSKHFLLREWLVFTSKNRTLCKTSNSTKTTTTILMHKHTFLVSAIIHFPTFHSSTYSKPCPMGVSGKRGSNANRQAEPSGNQSWSNTASPTNSDTTQPILIQNITQPPLIQHNQDQQTHPDADKTNSGSVNRNIGWIFLMAGINKTSRVMIKIIQAEDSIQILQQHQPTLSGFNKFTLKMWIGGIFPIARFSDCHVVSCHVVRFSDWQFLVALIKYRLPHHQRWCGWVW